MTTPVAAILAETVPSEPASVVYEGKKPRSANIRLANVKEVAALSSPVNSEAVGALLTVREMCQYSAAMHR